MFVSPFYTIRTVFCYRYLKIILFIIYSRRSILISAGCFHCFCLGQTAQTGKNSILIQLSFSQLNKTKSTITTQHQTHSAPTFSTYLLAKKQVSSLNHPWMMQRGQRPQGAPGPKVPQGQGQNVLMVLRWPLFFDVVLFCLVGSGVLNLEYTMQLAVFFGGLKYWHNVKNNIFRNNRLKKK